MSWSWAAPAPPGLQLPCSEGSTVTGCAPGEDETQKPTPQSHASVSHLTCLQLLRDMTSAFPPYRSPTYGPRLLQCTRKHINTNRKCGFHLPTELVVQHRNCSHRRVGIFSAGNILFQATRECSTEEQIMLLDLHFIFPLGTQSFLM